VTTAPIEPDPEPEPPRLAVQLGFAFEPIAGGNAA